MHRTLTQPAGASQIAEFPGSADRRDPHSAQAPALQPAAFACVCIRGEILFLPVCSLCGRIITKVEEANITASDSGHWKPITIDGTRLRLISDVTFILHWGCEKRIRATGSALTPWVGLDYVVKESQRQ